MAESRPTLGKLIRRIEKINPQLIITPLTTPTFSNDVRFIERIKNKVATHISAIGLHPTIMAQTTLETSSLDSVIRGEPELTSLKLAEALENNLNLKGTEGLSYKDHNRIFHNPDRPLIEDLDILPFPAREMLNLSRYRLPTNGKKYTFIVPSRGCWHNCIFCQTKNYYGNKLRLRSMDNIMMELREVTGKLKIRNIAILSDNFTLEREFVKSFCEKILENNFKIEWMANSRVDAVDYPLLALMKKSGCCGIAYGVESGNQRILDSAKKGITVGQTRKAFYWSNKAGIRTLAQAILGLPGETRDTAKETLKLLCEINPDFVQFNCAVPFPGTELYELASKNKWLEDAGWDRFELNYSVISTEKISAQGIMRLRSNLYFKFYFRFKYLKKILSNLRFYHITGAAKFFVGWVLNIHRPRLKSWRL